jgi:benzoyl-CoA reductase subunit D
MVNDVYKKKRYIRTPIEDAMLETVTAGLDVGNSTTKAVVLYNGQMSYAIVPTMDESEIVAGRALSQALDNADLSLNDIQNILGSGAGGKGLELADQNYLSSISCAVMGINHLYPPVRTVIDIGAEGFCVAKCDGEGMLLEYEQHQKCGSGGGLFLEVAAELLGVEVDKIGELSLQAAQDLQITATCAVFAESEIVSLVHKGKSRADIIKAVHDSIGGRIVSMLSSVAIEEDVACIGGVARNIGMVEAIKKMAKVDILVPDVPEIVVALGAALAAKEKGGEVK